MPPETAIEAAEKLRQQLLNKERAAAVRLVQAYGDIYKKLQSQIDALIAELDTLAARGELSVWKAGKLDQLTGLKRQIEVEVTRYAAVVENEINQGARDAILSGQRDAKALTQAALPGIQQIDSRIMASWNSLNPAAVETMLGFLSEDSPLRIALREQLGAAVADQVGAKLLEGIALGYSPRKVAQIIRRETGQGLVWSLRTARTAQLYAYRESSRAAYMANPTAVKGWTWRSARTATTCLACLAQDGTEHKADERLNDHYNGKCVMIPRTPTYKELGFNVEEAPPVSGSTLTGEQWFKSQPEAIQRQMMGKGKFEAWKSDKFKFEELVGEHTDKTYGKMVIEKPLKDLLKTLEAA